MELKFCKNCKHYETELTYYGYCARNTYKHTSLETGKVTKRGHIYTDREPEDPKLNRFFVAILSLDLKLLKAKKCGPEGKYYEAM